MSTKSNFADATARLTWREQLARFVEKHEGRRWKPYKDTVGKLTIGVGRNLSDNGLLDDEVDLILRNDLDRVLRFCETLLYWPALDPVRQLAIADMVFNLGPAAFVKFVQMNRFMVEGNHIAAAEAAERSAWFNQVGRRGQEIVEMLRTGKAAPLQ